MMVEWETVLNPPSVHGGLMKLVSGFELDLSEVVSGLRVAFIERSSKQARQTE